MKNPVINFEDDSFDENAPRTIEANIVAFPRGKVSPRIESKGQDVSFGQFDDKLEFDAVCSELKCLNIRFRAVSKIYLKFGDVNFYLPKGKIFINGEPKYPRHGFQELLTVLRARKYIK